MNKHTNNQATTTTKAKPGFWSHFAISLTIVGGMLAANFSSKAAESFSVDVIANATLELNHQARHFIMLDQPDWLAVRIARALKD